jgi:hypothetical protein
MGIHGPASPATRSNFVFAANDIVTNRFQLCALTAKTSRRLAQNLKRQPENINQALRMIADGTETFPHMTTPGDESNQSLDARTEAGIGSAD